LAPVSVLAPVVAVAVAVAPASVLAPAVVEVVAAVVEPVSVSVSGLPSIDTQARRRSMRR
jgi:hypothetical protein